MERMAQYTAQESDNGQIYVGHNIVRLKRVGTIWNIWHKMEGYNMERIAQTLYNTRHRSLIMAKYVGPALVAAALPRANSSSSLSFSSDDEEEVHDNNDGRNLWWWWTWWWCWSGEICFFKLFMRRSSILPLAALQQNM